MVSKLDFQSGFHQLRIREGDQHKTAFTTPGAAGAQYEWVTCPFGLTNTPSCFQRLMNHVLFDHITANYCVVYCDNVLIYTETDDPTEHMAKLTAVLDTLREHELLIKGSKTELLQTEVEFLGFQLSATGWAPTESKVKVIVEWPTPQTVKHLRSFLGMAIFFRTFLPLYSEASAPLTDLLKNKKHGQHRLNWTLECELAFAKIKEDLTSGPVLRHFDPSLRMAVHIDGSQNAVGSQWQENEDNPRPVEFISRKLSGAQYRYDARNVEALAAQMALTTWRTLLLGVKFENFSDHDSLQYLSTQKSPSQHILRLCEFLADYNFEEVKYVLGPQNVVPDFLSRPWEATANEPASLHMLVKRWPKHKSS